MIKLGDLQKCQPLISQPFAITIGKFGVLHKGHEAILNKLHEFAENGYNIGVFSFHPSPALFFSKDLQKHGRIFSAQQINRKLEQKFSPNFTLFLQKFNADFATLTPEDFIFTLAQKINLKYIIIGEDFKFGKAREGDIKLLRKLGQKYGFEVASVELVNEDLAGNHGQISTTNLRNLLLEGKITKFNELTAFEMRYEIEGKVLRGQGLAGQKLGYKTANIAVKSGIVLPNFGVYLCRANKSFYGIANLGLRPTVGGFLKPLLEVHIFEFEQQIYGQSLNIEFLEFVREERKFASLEELKNQIEVDVLAVKKLLSLISKARELLYS